MSFKNFQTLHPYNKDSSRKLYGQHDYDEDDSSDEESDEEAVTGIILVVYIIIINNIKWNFLSYPCGTDYCTFSSCVYLKYFF